MTSAEWPTEGAPVVVWHEIAPSRSPRDPHEATVRHVGPRTFHVEGLDSTFNRSTGRSRTERSGGELTARTYVAVPADSERGQQVLTEHALTRATRTAMDAAQAWLADRSTERRRALRDALAAIDEIEDR